MKVAIVGSRKLRVDIGQYVPDGATEIISGGAKGIDSLAEAYAREKGLPLRVFRPQPEILGKMAFLVRNDQIVDAADLIVAIWDGSSPGTRYTISRAQRLGKPVQIHILRGEKEYIP